MHKTKEKIFDIAIKLFSLKGYDNTSIRDITNAVGISKSSLYNHFSNKKEILTEIISYYNEERKTDHGIDLYINDIVINNTILDSLQIFTFGFIENSLSDNLSSLYRILIQEQYNNIEIAKIYINELKDFNQLIEKIFNSFQKNKKINKEYNIKNLSIIYSYGINGLISELQLNNFHKIDLNNSKAKIKNFINSFVEYLI